VFLSNKHSEFALQFFFRKPVHALALVGASSLLLQLLSFLSKMQALLR
jgi:hypothetical protein